MLGIVGFIEDGQIISEISNNQSQIYDNYMRKSGRSLADGFLVGQIIQLVLPLLVYGLPSVFVVNGQSYDYAQIALTAFIIVQLISLLLQKYTYQKSPLTTLPITADSEKQQLVSATVNSEDESYFLVYLIMGLAMLVLAYLDVPLIFIWELFVLPITSVIPFWYQYTYTNANKAFGLSHMTFGLLALACSCNMANLVLYLITPPFMPILLQWIFLVDLPRLVMTIKILAHKQS